jgi:serine/threonine protein kinase
MGLVYKVADQLHPDRSLALKTIRTAEVMEFSLGMFKAEFKTMTSLHHPNVAQVYDFEPIQGSTDSLFTMEFVQGKDLMAATEGMDIVIHVDSRRLKGLQSTRIRFFELLFNFLDILRGRSLGRIT